MTLWLVHVAKGTCEQNPCGMVLQEGLGGGGGGTISHTFSLMKSEQCSYNLQINHWGSIKQIPQRHMVITFVCIHTCISLISVWLFCPRSPVVIKHIKIMLNFLISDY